MDISLDNKSSRLYVVDALRGFAMMAIILLHNIEHFDIYYFPDSLPEWMKIFDGRIWKIMFFLFSGKSYAIFALLFGFTFFIMLNNQAKKGFDFRGRFLWRLLLLFIFGLINSIFFMADILAIYALVGVSLVVVCKWSNKVVLFIAIFFLIQPLEWIKFIYMLFNPDYSIPDSLSHSYYLKLYPELIGSSFWELAKANLWYGRLSETLWAVNSGRIMQTFSLFMLGMLVGRKGLFIPSELYIRFWKRAMVVSVFASLALHFMKLSISHIIHQDIYKKELVTIIQSWSNFAQTIIMVSLFIILYQTKFFYHILKILEPYGRTSLTNYVTSSIIGSFLYYEYGLGLYRYAGSFYSLLIGIVIFTMQLAFCHLWLKYNKRGPLEGIWFRLTWIDIKSVKDL
jgi:uncharacterized protein